jgi:hypothetical protein
LASVEEDTLLAEEESVLDHMMEQES